METMEKVVAVKHMSNGSSVFAVKRPMRRHPHSTLPYDDYCISFASSDEKIADILSFRMYNDSRTLLPTIVEGFSKILDGFSSEVLYEYFTNNDTRRNGQDSFEKSYEKILKDPDLSSELKVLIILFSSTQEVNAKQPVVEISPAKEFMKTSMFSTRNSVNDLKMIMYPLFSQYGVDEFDFMKEMVKQFTSHSVFSSPQYRKTIKLMFTLFSTPDDGDKTTLFADMKCISLESFKKVGYKVNDFPIQQKKYRDYLLSLPVWQVRLLLDDNVTKVSSDTKAEIAIDSSEKFLKNLSNPVSIVDTTHALYNAAFDSMYTSMKSNDDLSGTEQLHALIYEHQEKTQAVVALTDHFRNSDYSAKFQMAPVRIVRLVLENPGTERFKNGFKKWVDENSHIDYIMGKLHEVAKEKAVQHVCDAAELCKEPLTFDQWEYFIDNYETLGIIPTSWWIDML